jgi:nucleotide-binding universal stress UspA family protein
MISDDIEYNWDMPSKIKGKFSKILVAIDGSQSSMDAAEYAIEMAKKDAAQIIAVTVNRISLSSYGLATPEGELESPQDKEIILESKERFANLDQIAKQNNVELKTELINSQMSIDGTIVEYAESEDVDLIIMGTRGRSGFKKLLLGSIASAVVTYSPCPVMIVK